MGLKLYATITIEQMKWLKAAIDMAEDWRGNHDPKSYDEFDSWIEEMRFALECAERDRKAYRKLMLELQE